MLATRYYLLVKMPKKRALANKKGRSPQGGPKLRLRSTRERKLTPAENATAWNLWVTRGPHGPIEDDREASNGSSGSLSAGSDSHRDK